MLLLGLDSHLEFSATHISFRYLPLILILSFGFCFGLGIGAVPYTLSGELFPQQLRSYGAGIALASRYIFAFIQLKIFLVMVDAIGMSGFYWIQAATAISAGAFALLMLPETRDKTFAKLEIIFAAKESKKNPV